MSDVSIARGHLWALRYSLTDVLNPDLPLYQQQVKNLEISLDVALQAMKDEKQEIKKQEIDDGRDSAGVPTCESAEGVLRKVAVALELPDGAHVVEYARHVKELCAARAAHIGQLNRGVIAEKEVLARCHHEDEPVRRKRQPTLVMRLRVWADWLAQEGEFDPTLHEMLREAVDALREQGMAKTTRGAR
jgi:hypothetical protein